MHIDDIEGRFKGKIHSDSKCTFFFPIMGFELGNNSVLLYYRISKMEQPPQKSL